MSVIMAIAALCIPGATNDGNGSGSHLRCQKYYVTCLDRELADLSESTKPSLIYREAFLNCISKKTGKE